MRGIHPAAVTLTLVLAGCTAGQRATDFRFVEATIDDVHAAIRSGQMSCSDIVQGYLRRIDTYDKPTGLNAIIFTNPAAVDEARAIDEREATPTSRRRARKPTR